MVVRKLGARHRCKGFPYARNAPFFCWAIFLALVVLCSLRGKGPISVTARPLSSMLFQPSRLLVDPFLFASNVPISSVQELAVLKPVLATWMWD